MRICGVLALSHLTALNMLESQMYIRRIVSMTGDIIGYQVTPSTVRLMAQSIGDMDRKDADAMPEWVRDIARRRGWL